MARKGDGISVHRWTFCATCKRQNPERTTPAEGCKRCKVAAWRVFYRNPEGKNRSKVFDCAKVANAYEEAKAFKAKTTTDKREGTYVDPADAKILFLDFADEWAAAQEWKDGGSADKWPTTRKLLGRYVGEKTRLWSIDKLKLQKVRNDLNKSYALSYVAGTMRTLNAIMRAAAASGRIPRDPTTGVKATPKRRADDKSGRVTPDMVPTVAEAHRLMSAAPDPYRAVHALGLAGLRISEALGMQWDHVHFHDDGTLSITVGWQVSERRRKPAVLATPKNEKARTIVVPAVVAAELRRHRDAGYGGVWVETKDDGTTVEHPMLFMYGDKLMAKRTFYDHAYYKVLTAAGFPKGRFTFHGYRHLVASQLLSEGAPLPAVAGYIGDHVHTVTRVYAHWLRDDQDVPPSILNRAFNPADAPIPDAAKLRDASPLPHAA